jgi:hypothetical protein
VALAICKDVYGGRCACDARRDLPVCSTMWGAAETAIRLTRSFVASA